MAKKFMYVCVGIMALAVTFHIGAEYGKASIVDPTPSGIVAVRGNLVLVESGDAYMYEQGYLRWLSMSEFWDWVPPPMPVSDIKFWEGNMVVTQNGEVWYWHDTYIPPYWANIGVPGGPTATQPSTWGKIKAEWGE